MVVVILVIYVFLFLYLGLVFLLQIRSKCWNSFNIWYYCCNINCYYVGIFYFKLGYKDCI